MTQVEVINSPYFIAVLFFFVAFTCSAVGLGGGSSYTAIMALLGFSTLAIPMISLSMNLMVTSVGSFNFIRNKHARIRLILPFFGIFDPHDIFRRYAETANAFFLLWVGQ